MYQKNLNHMINRYVFLILILSFFGCKDKVQSETKPPVIEPPVVTKTDVAFWVTSPEAGVLFQKKNGSLIFSATSNQNPTIDVDTSQTFQTIDGFGYCLTGGSATLIHKMDATNRAALLTELFATDASNIGTSYLRVSIGASDLSDHVFSYDDVSGGIDPNLTSFSIAEEKTDLIPVLKEILAINPDIKILGSPWSAPVWMKTNGDTRGGSLKPEYFVAYANYFVKYIQAMKSEGIRIDAITIQNEPLHPGNNPSMYMTAEDQALFIKNNLGPAFTAAGIDTKIIVYDHNADRPDYPLTILNDPEAAKYVDGSAFHLYAGSIDALSGVHNAFPSKNLYFTEQWVGAPGNLAGDLAWHVRTLLIGGTRNWCKTVLEWNLAADPNNDPHTDRGGCDQCLGAITINHNIVTRNPAYYIIAHAAKFVRSGSVRINSGVPLNLPNVAFRTPTGQKVLIVLNDNSVSQSFNISFNGKIVTASLDKGAVGTFVW
jgi:glucosylceramidase